MESFLHSIQSTLHLSPLSAGFLGTALIIGVFLWAIYVTLLHLNYVRPIKAGKIWYDEDNNLYYYIAPDGSSVVRPTIQDCIAEASARNVCDSNNMRIDVFREKPIELNANRQEQHLD